MWRGSQKGRNPPLADHHKRRLVVVNNRLLGLNSFGAAWDGESGIKTV